MTQKKQFAQNAQTALERKILQGLSCEWDAATHLIKKDHREIFKKPLFSLKNMKRKLGYWSAERKEICLNRDFVLDHPWDSIREVLLHEMAHQFTDQVYGADHEPPHGPQFKKACHLLRANPKASGSYQPLNERVLSGSHEKEDRIMLRIKKLMALSESSNQHEAEAAMSKVHELLSKYNIHLFEHHIHREFESIFLGTPALRHHREAYFISNLLQDFYFIQGIWVSAYVLEKNKMGRVLEISGTVQNIQIASYVYDFIKQFIHARWTDYNKDKTFNRYQKSDFAVGIIEGFRSKLESQQQLMHQNTHNTALIKIKDPLLVEYFSHKYPYIHNIRKDASSHNQAIFNDGKKIGKKLIIHKGIHDTIKSKIRYIQ